jgi:hypothetical protein
MTASVVHPSAQAASDAAVQRASIGMAGLGRRLAAIAGEAQMFELAFLHDGCQIALTLVEPMDPRVYERLVSEIDGPLQIQDFLDDLPAGVLDPAYPLADEFPTGTALLQFICASGIERMSYERLESSTPAAPVTGTLQFAMNDKQAVMVMQLHKRSPNDEQGAAPESDDRPTFH